VEKFVNVTFVVIIICSKSVETIIVGRLRYVSLVKICKIEVLSRLIR
jgi:hypothetical protein